MNLFREMNAKVKIDAPITIPNGVAPTVNELMRRGCLLSSEEALVASSVLRRFEDTP